MPIQRRRKRVGTTTAPIDRATGSNQLWVADFQFDATTDGRVVKVVRIFDEHTRESLGGLVERNIINDAVAPELDRIAATRDRPIVLRSDNGLQSACRTVADWPGQASGPWFIPPGQPWRNPFIESCNGRLRDECMNINAFWSLTQARMIITDWKHQHNHHRPLSALGYQAPAIHAAHCTYGK